MYSLYSKRSQEETWECNNCFDWRGNEYRKTEEKWEEEEEVEEEDRVAGAHSRWAGWDNQSREMSRVPRSPCQPPQSDRWQAWWMAAHSEHTPLGAREEKGRGGGEGGREDCEEGKKRAAGGQRGSQVSGDTGEKEGVGQSENMFVNDHWEWGVHPVHQWHVKDEGVQIFLWAALLCRQKLSHKLISLNPSRCS